MTLFAPSTKLQPRPYQREALEALDRYLCTKDGNPCVVLPTGSGKSPVMAWTIEMYKRAYPPFRCIVLAHVKELVEQNANKMRQVWPDAPIGIYAAGLRRRQRRADITFASIDSVYSRADHFEPFDLIIVDEAHRIPVRGEGKYRRFIAECQAINPRLRVAGFTATPYRLGSGPICHRDHILNEVCYEANVRDLIDDGYLCPLRSKIGRYTPDVSGVTVRGGEYVNRDLARAVDVPQLVSDAIREAVTILNAERRQGIIFFCVDVEHCRHVSAELRKYGIDAPQVTSQTPQAERDRIVQRFIDGELRAICNVNVLCEGFDATRTDAVVLLRPTQSKGLYSQMVGRGLRLDPRKSDCLVLDFANCIETHGPIDCIDAGHVEVVVCDQCREAFSRAVRTCPRCGWKIPPREVDSRGGKSSAGERSMHDIRPAQASIISEPETLDVDAVTVNRHRKPGKPDSLRVTYRCGLRMISEWVCLDHEGLAGRKAHQWWRRRFPGEPVPSVDEALGNLYLAARLSDMTQSIVAIRRGKYYEIIHHNLSIGATSVQFA